EAVRKCNEIMDELEGIGQLNRLPFDKLVEEYIDWYSARRKSSSVKALKTHTNNHLLPYFKSMDVFKITTQDVMKFQNKKLKEGHSGDYLKKMHVYLVSLLNHAMKFYDL
ncbi:N-terminal phage integrase SAM-like domain-containing protein, partial [Staphylococcus aureus]